LSIVTRGRFPITFTMPARSLTRSQCALRLRFKETQHNRQALRRQRRSRVVEPLLLFLLGCLLCLLRLLRFLGHITLRVVVPNACRHSTCMNSAYTTFSKLILHALNRVNDGRDLRGESSHGERKSRVVAYTGTKTKCVRIRKRESTRDRLIAIAPTPSQQV
jgi:hypothetical protein